jgi:hypothetical protein
MSFLIYTFLNFTFFMECGDKRLVSLRNTDKDFNFYYAFFEDSYFVQLTDYYIFYPNS